MERKCLIYVFVPLCLYHTEHTMYMYLVGNIQQEGRPFPPTHVESDWCTCTTFQLTLSESQGIIFSSWCGHQSHTFGIRDSNLKTKYVVSNEIRISIAL